MEDSWFTGNRHPYVYPLSERATGAAMVMRSTDGNEVCVCVLTGEGRGSQICTDTTRKHANHHESNLKVCSIFLNTAE